MGEEKFWHQLDNVAPEATEPKYDLNRRRNEESALRPPHRPQEFLHVCEQQKASSIPQYVLSFLKETEPFSRRYLVRVCFIAVPSSQDDRDGRPDEDVRAAHHDRKARPE